MGTLLLHNPWVQFYLLYVGALGVVFICDYLCNPSVPRIGTRTPPTEAAQHGPSPAPRPRSHDTRLVSRPGQRTDKQVRPHQE
jgi:hypothetical protein